MNSPIKRNPMALEIQLALRHMRAGQVSDSPDTWFRLIRWQLEGVA